MKPITNPTLSQINDPFFREQILEILRNHIQTKIVFTKNDGSLRTMYGTLNFMGIPEEYRPSQDSSGKIRKESIETIRVFETDLQEWRSFRVDSVIEISPEKATFMSEGSYMAGK